MSTSAEKSDFVDIFVGRQPIFNQNMEVMAYELLFRGNTQDNHAMIIGGDAASAQVMMNVFGEMGLTEVLGEHRGFINFTEGLLLREYQPFFPRRSIVIEVLEDVKVTPKLISSLAKLKEMGFTIALDDYIFNPKLMPLEEFADIIKVEILEVGPKQLIEHSKRLKAKGIKLLAEKVETREQFEFCLKLGFDYFQGYFFAKPKIIQGKRLPNNKLTMLELLANVYNPDIDMHQLSDIIGKDVSLSQKLLKFVAETNGSGVQISSIHDAVLRFGLNRLKSWASMLVLSGVDDKPTELFNTALTRAKFCELVGGKLGHFSKDSYFTVGLFSCLDAVMDTELSVLLEKLGLDDAIYLALLKQEGDLGIVLAAVKAMEQGKTDFELPANISATELSGLYLEAMQFAETIDLG
ncbi:EAL and HDOD domain-containing protein [Thiomicrorhabdus sp. Milos-T2]|uniref:EAL and HDOD domain-containing protein n=1 Tax=Thiomicrorhabdus sp. Milos-T2 TaxID=90814 RepID=UPI000493E347|nr:EAL domain-containing protein [Thiomicrorhabdus sp. Milos-T2]